MKIFFDVGQFPNALEACRANDQVVVLNHDIEYIPSPFNQVLIANNEADREDWQTVQDNWDTFIGYFIDVIQENMDENDADTFKDMACMDIFEYEFVICGVH